MFRALLICRVIKFLSDEGVHVLWDDEIESCMRSKECAWSIPILLQTVPFFYLSNLIFRVDTLRSNTPWTLYGDLQNVLQLYSSNIAGLLKKIEVLYHAFVKLNRVKITRYTWMYIWILSEFTRVAAWIVWKLEAGGEGISSVTAYESRDIQAIYRHDTLIILLFI